MKQVALITGGSRGIGYGIAEVLAMQGIDLAINGLRKEAEVKDVLDQLKSHGIDVIYCMGNIAHSTDRKNIIQQVKDHYQCLNILVNNAGMAPRERRDILNTSEESWNEVIDTNLKGTYFMSQDVANWMIRQKQVDELFNGMIINISSISATVASVNRGEYCVSKAGISMVTQLFATRLGEFNIPVYEVRPGIIHTDMTSGVQSKYDALIEHGLTIQKRWGFPEDVGKCVGALTAGHFPYSTGQVFMVEGGLTVSRL